MRFNPVTGTKEQRDQLRRRFDKLMQPDSALAVVREHVCPHAERAACSPARVPGNRFVIRVDTEAGDGARATYALKGYVDERALEIIDLYRLLLLDCGQRGERCPVVQPLCYAREQRVLVIPWVHGISLSDAMRATRCEIIDDALAHAPRALAQLHASLLVPEDPTTSADMVQATASRWHHHFVRFPDTRQLVTPLINLLHDALPHLSSTSPTLVHGDSAPGNILQDGASWQLLDLDTFGYADPAYDVGYLLARLEHECLLQPAFHDRAPELVARMLRACVEEMPDVSTSNVAFYYAMTLIRKVLSRYLRTHSFKRNARWPADVAHVVASATEALNAVASRTSPSFAAEHPMLRETGGTRSRH